MKKVMIDGFYGKDNLGDDYILYSLIDIISETKQKDVSVVCHENYQGYRWLYDQYPEIHFAQTRMQHSISFFRNIGYWIIGGGGLFPHEDSMWLLKKLLLIIFAKMCGTKVAIYGVEINPVHKKKNKLLWELIRRNCDFVYLRNKSSLMNFKNRLNVNAFSDVTFGLVTASERKGMFLDKHRELDCDYTLWALAMPWSEKELSEKHYQERYELLLDQISEIINQDSCIPVFVPFFRKNDLRMIQDLSKKVNKKCLICDAEYLTEEKRQIFAYANKCFCMRYHSVLFALYYEKDFVTISYSPKTTEILKEYGLEDHSVELGIRPSNFFYNEFDIDTQKLQNLFRKDPDSHIIRETSQILKSKALKSKEFLKRWMGG